MEILALSTAWRRGNKAENIVNGVDYFVNTHGLNFMVLDPENVQLIDFVGFDCHAIQHGVRRRR